jgi:hypothetical protein
MLVKKKTKKLSWHTGTPVEWLAINAEKEMSTRMHKTAKK